MKSGVLNTQPFLGFTAKSLKHYANATDIQFLPGLYEDSSSAIWRIKSNTNVQAGLASELIIKKCMSHKTILKTPFWKGMNNLFDLTLPQAYQNARYSYHYIASKTNLRVPKVIDVLLEPSQSAVILEEIPGKAVNTADVTDSNVKDLAQFIAKLHQNTNGLIGQIKDNNSCSSKVYVVDNKGWHQKLSQTLLLLNETATVSSKIMQDTLLQINLIEVNHIAPIMLDLRWDQFAEVNGELTAIFDLDAFVFAPIELDFVILEYLLKPQQIMVFREAYESFNGALIVLTDEQRSVYRVLLFLMNVLGETN